MSDPISATETRPDPLTVIIPLFNGAAFIGETLDSLAAQTVPLSEVIVVDDGSADEGIAIARSHRLRPRVIERTHGGVAAARNCGALAASARYIAFLDQDDLWLPRRHERILSFLRENPGCRALATNERSFYLERDHARLSELDEGLHKGADHPKIADVRTLLTADGALAGSPNIAKRIDTRELLRGTITVTTSYVFERELFFAAGGCAVFARSMDDYWTLLNVSRFTDIPMLDEPSVLYRIHPSSTTMSTSWPMPLLTSLAAARFGGNLVPGGHARDPKHVAPLDAFWQHQLLALADTSARGLLDALALVQLLACSNREQLSLTLKVVKRALRTQFRRSQGDD
jgi:hypothetical protein